ncbi:MAG: hypothetical protein ABFC24_00535 [Methanoregulaceae archaeon]
MRSGILSLAVAVIFLGTLIPCGAAFVLDTASFKIQENGNADATIQFQLEGLVENAIPDSILESELKKGLTTDPANPPVLKSFSRSGIVLLMPSYASVQSTGNGTRYATAALNFSKAETALKSSALNYLVSADFTPSTVTIVFPDGYTETLKDVGYLPSSSHVVALAETPTPQVSRISATPSAVTTEIPTTALPTTAQATQTPEPTPSAGVTPGLAGIAISGAAVLFLHIRRSG